MNDFDPKLRHRLQRLEAAAPEPNPPLPSNLGGLRVPRRRQVLLALAAVLALVIGTSLVTAGARPPRDPAQIARDAADEVRLSEDLEAHWGDCLSESEARALVQERLNALGLGDWTFRLDRPSLAEAPCVGPAPIGDSHQVMLSPSMGNSINNALEAFKVDLLSRCLDRAQAAELLRATLESAGVREPRIAFIGIRATPVDDEERKAYLQHFADGCVVFGDAQSDQSGRYTWSLSAR
jgi:hypothetical protein